MPQPMKSMLTLTAEVHLGRCSPSGACSPSAALRSPLRGDYRALGCRTEAARVDCGWYWAKYGGTNIVRLAFFFFLRRLTRPKVHLCKYAVRVGDSSRLRGRRGVSRGAENVLRIEESTLEKQVSIWSWGQLFPTLQRFWCLGDNWGCRLSESRVSACQRPLRRR